MLLAVGGQASAEGQFSDLPKAHWAYADVVRLQQEQVISGYADGSFQPDKTINRAEFAVLLAKAAGVQAASAGASTYADVAMDNWYAAYVEAVKEQFEGGTAGGEQVFHPEGEALREDIAVALVKMLKLSVAEAAGGQAAFADAGEISEAARPYVARAAEAGLLSGYEDQTFKPKKAVTRAEAAVLLGKAFRNGQVPQPQTPATEPPQPEAEAPVQQASERNKMYPIIVENLLAMSDTNVDGYTSEVIQIAPAEDGSVYVLEKRRTVHNGKPYFVIGKLEENKISYKEKDLITPIDQIGGLFYDLQTKEPWIGGYSTDGKRIEVRPSKSATGTAPFVLANPNTEWVNYPDSNFYLRLNESQMILSDIRRGQIMLVNSSGEAERLAIIPSKEEPNRRVQALIQQDAVYVMDTLNQELSVIPLSTKEEREITRLDLEPITAIAVHEGQFYLASGGRIYQLTTKGELSEFVDLSKLRYIPGMMDEDKRITSTQFQATFEKTAVVGSFAFDSDGNMVLYDKENNLVRWVHFKDDSSKPEQTTSSQAANKWKQLNLRAGFTADAVTKQIAPIMYPRDFIDIAPVSDGGVMVLYAINSEQSYDKKKLYILKQYDSKTGQIYSYTIDKEFSVYKQNDKPGYSPSLISVLFIQTQQLVYNMYTKEVWLPANYLNEKMTNFFKFTMRPEVKVKLGAYNFEQNKLTSNDFLVFTSDGRMIYSDVKEKWLYVDGLAPDRLYLNEDLQRLAVEFSGERVAAVEDKGILYYFDTGTKKLNSILLSTGTRMSSMDVPEQVDAIKEINGTLVYLSGRKFYRLGTDGKSRLLLDLDTVAVQKGMYDPVTKTNNLAVTVPAAIGTITGFTGDGDGHLYLLEKGELLWRIQLFEGN
ncbi:S-layer homology domain-containing protein [Paenibacillus sp. y28]|uniref:S-layer homology domain-containing protein n=1 Tax=Paenibacillus sp. y28 TaxID=3129110 RepID=UPI00301AFD9F